MNKRRGFLSMLLALSMILSSISPAYATGDQEGESEVTMSEVNDFDREHPEEAVNTSGEDEETEKITDAATEEGGSDGQTEDTDETGKSEAEPSQEDASREAVNPEEKEQSASENISEGETNGKDEEESEAQSEDSEAEEPESEDSLDVENAAASGDFSDISFEIYWASAAGGDVTDYHYDDSAKHHDFLVCTPANNANKTVNLRWEIVFESVEVTYPAGSIKMTVPAAVFTNWDGGTEKVSYTDEGIEQNQMSWQIPQAPESNNQSDFNYTVDENGNYIVTNCRDINGGNSVAFTANYSYRPTMVPGGYIDEAGAYQGNYLNKTITSTLSVDPDLDGTEDYTTQDTAHVEVHTQVKPTAINKHQPTSTQDANEGIYFSWQNVWGEKPADADDYFYVIWFADVSRNIGTTQPFVMDMVDLPDNGGVVVGAKQVSSGFYANWTGVLKETKASTANIAAEGWESLFHDVVGVSGETSSDVQSRHLAMMDDDGYGRTMYNGRTYAILVKYPVSLIRNLEEGESLDLTNLFRVTETWKERAAAQTSQEAAGTLSIRDINYGYGGPGYQIRKVSYEGVGGKAWTVSGAASMLLGGNDVLLRTAGSGNANKSYDISTTAGPKSAPQVNGDGTYTAKPYTMEVTDGDVSIGAANNVNCYNSYEKYEQESWRNVAALEDGDYAFPKLTLTLSAYDAQYSAGMNIWTKETAVSTAYDRYGDVEVWCRTAGSDALVLYGTASVAEDGKMTFTSENGSYTVTGGTRTCTFDLPEGTSEFKVRHTSAFYQTQLLCQPQLRINGTERVQARVREDLDRGYNGVIICNNASYQVLDENGSVEENSQLDTRKQPAGNLAYYLNQMTFDTILSKTVKGSVQDTPANGIQTRSVSLRASNRVLAPDEYKKSPYLDAYVLKKGVFYDLLPVGTSVNPETVRIHKSNGTDYTGGPYYYSSDFCTVSLVDNWEGSGQTMLVIEYELPSEINHWYDGDCSHVEVRYELTNSYENIIDQGTSVLNTAAHINLSEDTEIDPATDAEFAAITKKAQYENLREQYHDEIVFAQAAIPYSPVTVNQSGVTKKAMTGLSNGYQNAPSAEGSTGGADTYQGEGYHYRLTYTTSDSTRGTDIVLFDVLENGSTDASGATLDASQWKGRFVSVNVSTIAAKHSYDSETKRNDGPLCDPVVYYATTIPDYSDLSVDALDAQGGVWSTSLPEDPSAVKAIAIDCRKTVDGTRYVLDQAGAINAYVYMKAPIDRSLFEISEKPVAVNEVAADQTMVTTGSQTEAGVRGFLKSSSSVDLWDSYCKLTYHVVSTENPDEKMTDETPEQETDIPFASTKELKPGLTTRDVEKDGIPGTWTFSGWYDNAECTGDPIPRIEKMMEDKDVYGRWDFVPTTYNLRYHIVSTENPDETKTDATPATVTGIEYMGERTIEDPLTTIDTVDKNGVPGTWTFSGWYDNENCEGDPITDIENITEDQDVYGKWEFVPTTYNLNYHIVSTENPDETKTEETPDTVTGIEYKATQMLEDGLTTTDTVNKDGVPGTWVFSGWYDNENCEGDPITKIEDITEDQDNGVPGTWTFSGWYANEDCTGTPITNIEDITEDQDVYGKWEFVPTTYTLNYVVVGDKPSAEKTDDTPDTVTDIPYNTVEDIADGLTTTDTVNKDGVPGTWTFSGWYDNEDCTGDPVDPVTITEDKTVYGKWEFVPTTYNLNYHIVSTENPDETKTEETPDTVTGIEYKATQL